MILRNGCYFDSWNNDAMTKTRRGHYVWEGDRVTVRWMPEGGCSGDWSMTVQGDGDQLRWTDIEALPPEDDPYSQILNEAFNGTSWTRVGAAQDAARA